MKARTIAVSPVPAEKLPPAIALPAACVPLALVAAAGRWVTPYMAFATFSYSCMVAGVLSRRHRAAHATLMALAVTLDLAIVLALEVQRNAVKTALSFSLSPLQQLHIGFSTAATLLYVPILVLGFGNLTGKATRRSARLHRSLGVIAFAFRTAGFLLMFSMLLKEAGAGR